ncbi:MAG: hypothetical protein ABIH11_05270 [Candidatus Altiarchaeota archaeon]
MTHDFHAGDVKALFAVLMVVVALGCLCTGGDTRREYVCPNQQIVDDPGECPVFEDTTTTILETSTTQTTSTTTTTTTSTSNTTTTTTTTIIPLRGEGELSIGLWNLGIFREGDGIQQDLIDYYAGKMREHDIIVLQRISEASDEAFTQLCGMMGDYKCVKSSMSGEPGDREQYGIIYKNAIIIHPQDWNYGQFASQFKRPPYGVTFKAGNWTFQVLTIRIGPDDVKKELTHLETVSLIQGYYGEDIIVMGDLSADCRYYDSPPVHFDSWMWVVPDDGDTTSGFSDCAYDRVIISRQAVNNYRRYGIMRNVTQQQSDRYLVYAQFSTETA